MEIIWKRKILAQTQLPIQSFTVTNGLILKSYYGHIEILARVPAFLLFFGFSADLHQWKFTNRRVCKYTTSQIFGVSKYKLGIFYSRNEGQGPFLKASLLIPPN